MQKIENAIAIDSSGTSLFEQAYSCDGNCVWIHIVSLVDKYHTWVFIKLIN